MKAMKEALERAGMSPEEVIEESKAFEASTHAIDRTVERLGVSRVDASNHLNMLMSTAYRKGVTGEGVSIFDHYNSSTRLIVCEEANKIITVYKTPETVEEADFTFLKDVLNREIRKLHRQYSPKIRKIESKYAEVLKEVGEQAIRRARARNPKAREIIAKRIIESQDKADSFIREMEKLQRDWRDKINLIELMLK